MPQWIGSDRLSASSRSRAKTGRPFSSADWRNCSFVMGGGEEPEPRFAAASWPTTISCENVAGRAVPFQFHHDHVAFAVQPKQVDEGIEVGGDLPADDENRPVLEDAVGIRFEPLLQDRLPVFRLERRGDVLDEPIVRLYSEDSHGYSFGHCGR